MSFNVDRIKKKISENYDSNCIASEDRHKSLRDSITTFHQDLDERFMVMARMANRGTSNP